MNDDIKAKMERSSLGTPAAQALRATVSDEHAARIVARAKELEQQSENDALPFACCAHCGCQPSERIGHDDTCRLCQCSCGNRYDGDNLCMVSACQWEGIETSVIPPATTAGGRDE